MRSDASRLSAAAKRGDDRPRTPSAVFEAFRPLSHKNFRRLWLTIVVTHIACWVHIISLILLTTTIAVSAGEPAVVQSAAQLPMLATPVAGAFVDRFSSRAILLTAQAWLLCVSMLLCGLVAYTPIVLATLLLFAFLFGGGVCLIKPAWQEALSILVPPEDVQGAVALEGMGFNLARVLGPALGATLFTAVPPAYIFAVNGLLLLPFLYALIIWRPAAKCDRGASGSLFTEITEGLRLCGHTPHLRRLLARTFVFITFIYAFIALLPSFLTERPGFGSNAYGAVLGSVGGGAVIGVFILPLISRHVSEDARIKLPLLLISAAMAAFLWSNNLPTTIIISLVYGVFWLMAVSTLNAAVMREAPVAFKGRVLSVYLLAFFCGSFIGSALSGLLGSYLGALSTLWCVTIGLTLYSGCLSVFSFGTHLRSRVARASRGQ